MIVNIDKIEKRISEARRQTPTFWEGVLDNIKRNYLYHVDNLIHPLQKDALQNSVDAQDPNARQIVVRFELIDEANPPLFIIADSGTTGLTGRILSEEEMRRDLPEEERWGRFEGYAFLRPDPTKRGARGQGKFVFVMNSKKHLIVYDTYRKDGVYRLGARKLGDLDNPVEGARARAMLKQYFPALQPLQTVGTRIIIVDPVEELKEAFLNGSFKRYIQTTWWRLLENGSLRVILKHGSDEQTVEVPSELRFPTEDSKSVKVWIRRDCLLKRGKRSTRVKMLNLCFLESPPPEDVRGIAILRGGMVITRFPVSDLTDLPPEKADRIYGFFEGDMGTEELLKKVEDPTHYGFIRTASAFGRGIVPQIRAFLANELRRFAEEKLGIEVKERPAGFYQLLRDFNRLLKELGITLSEGRPGKRRPHVSPRDIGVAFKNLNRPRGYSRVDFGEEVSFTLEVANRTDCKARVEVGARLEQAGVTVKDLLRKKRANIAPREKKQIGDFRVQISAGKLAPGRCKLIAELECLEHPRHHKGEKLDTAIFTLWVEQDPPPATGIFRDIKYVPKLSGKFGEKELNPQFRVESHPEGGYVLKISTSHPQYRLRCRNQESTNEYAVELLARAVAEIMAMEGLKPFDKEMSAEEVLKTSTDLVSLILEKKGA